jgi:hypothetical protein
VWTWDISWLPGPVKGLFFYLYLILDLYSRKIVGWEGYEGESADAAAEVVRRAVLAERGVDHPLVLHADNAACTIESPAQRATRLCAASSRLVDKPKGDSVLSDPDRLTAITDQHAQGGQGLRTRFGPTHAIAFLATGSDLVVGTLDRTAAVA